MPFQLVTIPFAFDTPGLMLPADFGIPLADLAAGQTAELLLFCTIDWDAPTDFYPVVALTPAGPYRRLGKYVNATSEPPGAAAAQMWILSAGDANVPIAAFPYAAYAIQACTLYLSAEPEASAPITGEGLAIVKIYS